MKHIGNELESILKNEGRKQKDVAKLLEMSEVNLSKLLKKKTIQCDLLEKICLALGVPISTFFEVGQNKNVVYTENTEVNYAHEPGYQVGNSTDLKKECEHLKLLLREKDARIEELKDMIRILKK